MKHFTQSTTLMGMVTQINKDQKWFEIKCRSGDQIRCFVGSETQFSVLRNLDGLDRNRVPTPANYDDTKLAHKLARYVKDKSLIAVEGIYQDKNEAMRFDARFVHLLHSTTGKYLFEDTHWWLTQITVLADKWLEGLFGEKLTYDLDDFARLYRTNLNITGVPSPKGDPIQEMATLSRLIYGLSSAYWLTGADRFLKAAAAGVRYQREAFRMLSHDGKYCFWAFGKRHGRLIIPSENPDDRGTVPLYEQIYALAGLAQYYRITAEWEVLEDIQRTVKAINDFYLDDKEKDRARPGHRGYFSHLDFATMRPDVKALGDNLARKNWNSIGDHLPAYLINLILALEPLPEKRVRDLSEFLQTCKRMLDETSSLIVEKFPDPDDKVPYVNERFMADWTPDRSWRWQQNRAVVGHNLKIAWNLTRVANYYLCEGRQDDAARLMSLATRLADNMDTHGIDQIRGGCFDVVERRPQNKMPYDFTWGNTKDFWQQEQAILAYLILYGHTKNEQYLDLYREMSAFWNLFFLDHDHNGIFFRVTESGLPYIQGNYGTKGGHSMSGYHAFELNYLAHIYIRTYLPQREGCGKFCLYFRPDSRSGLHSINVLPDFVKPGTLEVDEIKVNGIKRSTVDRDNFQIPLFESEAGADITVTYEPCKQSR